ncbi:type IV secretory system conjugative DNA transfer family protein [Enterococcus durans]|uniref:type IV secretory system conjugative DNA transfer family protein n=1 Tax=Enterococcus durans TaxID=53345 RepID=UPI003BEF4086
MRKYRRIIRNEKSNPQGYQITLVTFGLTLLLAMFFGYISYVVTKSYYLVQTESFFQKVAFCFSALSFFTLALTVFFHSKREEVSSFDIPNMTPKAKKFAKKIRRLFSDKQVTDVLKLSNLTRYGDEMPEIHVWLDNNCTSGYIAIENIGNYERLDREKYEQKLSGILSGKMKRFAVVSSELVEGDTYMFFYFEDTLTSNRIHIREDVDSLKQFVSEDTHAIKLSHTLIWHTDVTPMLSLISRTRGGKTTFVSKYLIPLMLLQNWICEFHSTKPDVFVNQFSGESEPEKIVVRAEYWVNVMNQRLQKIQNDNKETYLDTDEPPVCLCFDEIGNLNASLEMDKALKKRWEIAINKLTATGGGAGIHIVAISQHATKEGFLPSLARVNCSDAVIFLGGAADSATERMFLMPGFADIPHRSYGQGQGVARIVSSGKQWETPHYYETPWFEK